jgi:predicted naringenin-chalcone synthase
VIDGMQKHLNLSDAATEPSRAGLYRWGNVSSASVWCVSECCGTGAGEGGTGLGGWGRVYAVT